VPKIFAVLEMNLRDHTNVELHCCGLSDRPQTAKFAMKTLKCGQSQQVSEPSTDPEFENFECELVTLDQYGFDRVDWIKIDVEGFEDAVLEGSQETIRSNRPWLLLEDNGRREQHRQWLNDLCGPYEPAPVKSKTNTIWIPQ
jgi:FkbM family methyltransferase